MTPEERALLQKAVTLSEENNKMVRSILRSMRIQRFMTIIYWLFIIGTAVGAYYFIQPYLSQIISIYGGANDILKSFEVPQQ